MPQTKNPLAHNGGTYAGNSYENLPMGTSGLISAGSIMNPEATGRLGRLKNAQVGQQNSLFSSVTGSGAVPARTSAGTVSNPGASSTTQSVAPSVAAPAVALSPPATLTITSDLTSEEVLSKLASFYQGNPLKTASSAPTTDETATPAAAAASVPGTKAARQASSSSATDRNTADYGYE